MMPCTSQHGTVLSPTVTTGYLNLHGVVWAPCPFMRYRHNEVGKYTSYGN